MAFEMLVGLNVINEKQYQEYRIAMMPILERHEGCFGYDFKVSEVLRTQVNSPINRVFTIYFASKKKMDDFFKNPEYLKVKEKYFENSVGDTTIISSYEK
ncbi:MAG: DUF1330 domain-containing protein [Xenococcaceae cyanobacterium]